jgi:hypothetical protein
MADDRLPSIWTKVDYGLATTAEVETRESQMADEAQRRAWRRIRPFLDIASTLFWIYVFLMVFVADIDRDLIGNYAKYRFFFFAFVALWVVIAIRNTWAILFVFAYVPGFPLVVLLWKFPKGAVEVR